MDINPDYANDEEYQCGDEQPSDVLRHQSPGEDAEKNRSFNPHQSGVGTCHRQPRKTPGHLGVPGRISCSVGRLADGGVQHGYFPPFPKWGAIPSGITQNMKSLLENSDIESIFGN